MKNYVQPGNTITLTAPYAVASGDGLLVGAIFGVAAGTAALGETVEAALTGVYDLKKVASQAWAAGDKVYWDNTAKEATKTTTSNTVIGVAVVAVAGGAGDTIGRDAVYIADGGAPVLVRIVARRADAVTDFGDARLWSETTRVDLRVAEVPAPRPGDRIEIDGDAFLIQGEPVRDREWLVWTVDLRPV